MIRKITINSLLIIILGIIFKVKYAFAVTLSNSAILVDNQAQRVTMSQSVKSKQFSYEEGHISNILSIRLKYTNAFVDNTGCNTSDGILLSRSLSRLALEAKAGKTAVVTPNTDYHWTSLIVHKTNAGQLRAIFNDPTGNPIDFRIEQELKNIGVIEIVDLQIRQQFDMSSCGPLSSETLVVLVVKVDISQLSKEQLQEITSGINDADKIRDVHAAVLVGLNPKDQNFNLNNNKQHESTTASKGITDKVISKMFDKSPAYSKADTVNSNTLSLSRPHVLAVSTTLQQKALEWTSSYMNSLLTDRLDNIGFNLIGVAAGNNNLYKHGFWTEGFLGNQKDVVNSNMKGVILGYDYVVSPVANIGLAYAYTVAKTKSVDNSNVNNIFTVYGNHKFIDNMSVKASVSYGLLQVKKNNNHKERKGQLIGSNATVSYVLYKHSILSVIPRLGATYNHLSIDKYHDDTIKIAKVSKNQLDLNAGVVLRGQYKLSGIELLPKASIDYTRSIYKGNQIKVTDIIGGNVLVYQTKKQRDTIRFGIGLDIFTFNIEFGGGYEYRILGKNRNMNIGYLNFRINI